MKKIILTMASVALVAAAFCVENANDKAAMLFQRTGGFVIKPDSAKGKVAFFNIQQVYDKSAIQGAASILSDELHYDVDVVDNVETFTISNASTILSQSGAGAGVFLINGETSAPAILAAPDSSWSIVNVVAFKKDDALLSKQVLRAFAMCAGGHLSQAPISLMGPFKNSKQVSAIPTDKLPADTIAKILRNLKERGVEQYIQATYLKACREGWAPAPTNDVQKAIWDKIHAMPTEPIKIKPEEKKTEK